MQTHPVKIFFFLIFASQFSLQLKATDSLKHHVIILMDRSGSVPRYNSSLDIERLINFDLPNVLYNKGAISSKVIPKSRPLLNNGDYLSILSFGFAEKNPDVKDFIEIATTNNEFGLRYSSNSNRATFQKLHNTIARDKKVFYRKNWTGLSFAGPLSLCYLGNNDKPKNVNRTFVVIVTDGQFNGINDPNNEIKVYQGENFENLNLILENYNKIHESFLWRSVHKGGNKEKNKYKFEIFEYEPLQKTFSVEAVLPIPQIIELKRNSKGYFSYQLELKPYQKAKHNFKLEKISLTVIDSTNNKIVQNESYQHIYSDTIIDLKIDKFLSKENLILQSKFWIYFDDGTYGMHVLHPNGSLLQGKEGLNREIALQFEAQARIFGIIPLGSLPFRFFSFLSSDQYIVANLINYLSLLLFGILVLLHIWRKYTYTKLLESDISKIKW